MAGWMNERQLQVINHLCDANRVLHEQLGDRRLKINDNERRRLAVKARGLGRGILVAVATIVTPKTLLTRHRKLVAQKYDGSEHRQPGRPRTAPLCGACWKFDRKRSSSTDSKPLDIVDVF